MDNLRANDHTSIVEFASFLYQMHSYCSRQIKLDRLIKHFENETNREILSIKKVQFLEMSLEIYKKASDAFFKHSSDDDNDEKDDKPKSVEAQAEDDSFSSSNIDQAKPKSSKSSTKAEASKTQASFHDENNEEWLYQYMFGKIKEKLNYDLMECLEHYKSSCEHLERNGATILKRCTYRSKSCFYIELNEVFYRIYTLTLKRIEKIAQHPKNGIELQKISAFLESLTETKFVKMHDDFDFVDISGFLQEKVFNKSQQLTKIENSDLFINCVCLCVAGLHQILKRFSQHYRSLYRLANFYCKFLDFDVRIHFFSNFNNRYFTKVKVIFRLEL